MATELLSEQYNDTLQLNYYIGLGIGMVTDSIIGKLSKMFVNINKIMNININNFIN